MRPVGQIVPLRTAEMVNKKEFYHMGKVLIYTDGAARGNPDGPGGYGVVLHYTDQKGVLHERTLSA